MRLKCALFRKAISRWWNAFIKELLWLPAKWILFETAKLVGFRPAPRFCRLTLRPSTTFSFASLQSPHIRSSWSWKVGRTGNVGNRKWNPSEKIAEDEIGTKRLKRSGRRRYITSKVFRNCKSSLPFAPLLRRSSLSLFHLLFTNFAPIISPLPCQMRTPRKIADSPIYLSYVPSY